MSTQRHSRTGFWFAGILFIGSFYGLGVRSSDAQAVAAHAEVDYGRDVQPILARHCYACHGPDESTREADLKLHDRSSAMRVIDLERPAQSKLLRRLTSPDLDARMPPHPAAALSSTQITILRSWIESGAPYAEHWSWEPISRPAVPTVESGTWGRDPLDSFILRELNEQSLSPARDADRATLIRRLSFDLRGLPPTPEEIEAFLGDERSDDEAYAELVDAFLATPAYGERWGQHWLDLVRYAETHGHEYDYPIKYAWQYRDYVIRAMNTDVPFDQFLREHIAGDLLPQPRRHPDEGFNESLLATGFWFLGQATHGPVDVRGDEAERIDNQIDVISKAFLGVTVSCARCHDHKFDAISAKDYYALAGFLQSSRRQEAFLDPGNRIATAIDVLQPLNAELAQSILQELDAWSTSTNRDVLTKTIAAAIEVREGTRRPTDPEVLADARVFEDFESPTVDGWSIEGTAFASIPQTQNTVAEYQGDINAEGTGFINSHRTDNGEDVRQADEHIGRMTSAPFRIEDRWMHFRIGGGNHPGKTCINLTIDGEPVRTATGHNSNSMRTESFDLADLKGAQATIEIVDEVKGGWGNISVDAIVFSDDRVLTDRDARPLETVADEFNISPTAIQPWSRAFALESAHASNQSVEQLLGSLVGPRGERRRSVFESFDSSWRDRWFLSGDAFRHDARASVSDAGAIRIHATQTADSASVHHRLQGIARSATFEITKPYIEYDVRGQGGLIRIVIDGYVLDEYNALLFEGMRFDVNTPQDAVDGGWMTHVQNVGRYIGHRAHIEMIDEGSGWLEVDAIRFVETPSAAESSDATPAGTDDIASLTADRFVQAVGAVRTGRARPVDAAIVQWLVTQILDLDDAPTAAMAQTLESINTHASTLPSPMRALAIQDGTPEDEHVFLRGDHNSMGEVVERRFIESLGGDPSLIGDRGSGRMALAASMLSDDNPLTARVAVNRAWHHLTGRGIVPSTDDFGALGENPSHPELLDHLAWWFRTDGGWSTKSLVRRIVLSSTYRMSGDRTHITAADRDPQNTLLSLARTRRLSAEAIRDAVLAVSGQLSEDRFGPPVAIHLTPFMTGRGRPGSSGPLDGDGRRSIYLGVHRNFMNPMLLAFDRPLPSSTVGSRNTSNVPAQALTMMNDPFVHEQAALWASRLLSLEVHSDAERIDRMYREALGRPPSDTENRRMRSFLMQQANDYERIGVERPHSAAWADACHVVFNLKEFMFIR